MQIRPFILFAFLTACSLPQPDAQGAAPGLAELGGHRFAISTANAVAQEQFSQGLAWCYGFHHAEATRCFGLAVAADPDCAMAYWGLAFAAGPHINNMEMSPEAAQVAFANAQRAKALAARVTPLEQALIDAIAARYVWPAPADRKELDRAYAAGMRKAYEHFGDHPDVGALFAEALMDLWPWNLYRDDGSPQPDTLEVVAVLERVMAAHPRHPQANHLYIHATESSPDAARGVAAADRLRGLAPAIGHLQHMPAHAYLRVGRYGDAAEANRQGIAADLRTIARTGRVGFYELYRAHNYHFLAYAAMFTGNEQEAMQAARDMVSELPVDVVQQMPAFLEAFLAVPLHVLVRFGRWQEVLDEPMPPEWQKSCRAVWHYARGVALAALGRVDEAVAERAAFAAAANDVPADWTVGNNPTHTILAIGADFLEGEVEFRRGNHDVAFAALRRAMAGDEKLRYDEPWGWMMPPAHALGALLLEAGRVDEAQSVYLADLKRHPENGWALHGLAECQDRAGATAEAAATRKRFAAAWQHATIRIEASCFCRR